MVSFFVACNLLNSHSTPLVKDCSTSKSLIHTPSKRSSQVALTAAHMMTVFAKQMEV